MFRHLLVISLVPSSRGVMRSRTNHVCVVLSLVFRKLIWLCIGCCFWRFAALDLLGSLNHRNRLISHQIRPETDIWFTPPNFGARCLCTSDHENLRSNYRYKFIPQMFVLLVGKSETNIVLIRASWRRENRNRLLLFFMRRKQGKAFMLCLVYSRF